METPNPTLEDRVAALEVLVQQQYRVMEIFKNAIEQLSDAGGNVSRDLINVIEHVKILEKRVNHLRNGD